MSIGMRIASGLWFGLLVLVSACGTDDGIVLQAVGGSTSEAAGTTSSGITGSSGAPGTGGVGLSGATAGSATGGTATGGALATGGASKGGAATGGRSSTGGSIATGGTAMAGKANTAGAAGTCDAASFRITDAVAAASYCDWASKCDPQVSAMNLWCQQGIYLGDPIACSNAPCGYSMCIVHNRDPTYPGHCGTPEMCANSGGKQSGFYNVCIIN